MSSRVNIINRVVLALLALLIVLCAAAGLVIGFGPNVAGVSLPQAQDPIVGSQSLTAANDSPWFWWAVAAACLIVALLAARWLLAQLKTDRVGSIDLTHDGRDGTTSLAAGALHEAVSTEVEGYRGVESASAHLRGEPRHRLVINVDVSHYADIDALRERLEHGAVAGVRHATDDPDLPVRIEIHPTTTPRIVT